MQRSIDVGAEAHALFGDLRLLGQGEYLEAAAIGQDRSVPTHKRVQAPRQVDELWTGPEHQVIGIRQDDLRAETFDLGRMERLDGGLRSDRHEDRGLDRPSAGLELPKTRARVKVGRA